MKHALTAAATLAITAGAGADVMFHFAGPALLNATESATVFSGNLSGTATGFNFSFLYGEPTPGDASWASDMQITITAANGNSVTIGGYTSPIDIVPSYDGGGSSAPGVYGDMVSLAGFNLSGNGLWTVTIHNDANGPFVDTSPNSISDFNGLLVGVVPSPAGLSLFGIAGLAALRRRR